MPKSGAARPKVSAVPKDEGPEPPLFDQWLACLKFTTGWNDQGTFTADKVRDALRGHFAAEGIDHTGCIAKLTAVVVPLLLDLQRIDQQVVKNLPVDVLRGLKTVQVSILRIVTYEVCREQAAKDALKAQRKQEGPQAETQAAGSSKSATHTKPYLASDIATLAKVVQHFRFDRAFTQGLHKMILSIRKQKLSADKAEALAQGRVRRDGTGVVGIKCKQCSSTAVARPAAAAPAAAAAAAAAPDGGCGGEHTSGSGGASGDASDNRDGNGGGADGEAPGGDRSSTESAAVASDGVAAVAAVSCAVVIAEPGGVVRGDPAAKRRKMEAATCAAIAVDDSSNEAEES